MPLGAQLVLVLVFGLAGWHHAGNLENKYGREAWGLPSWVWGLITGFSLLIGAVLLAIAERGLKNQPALVAPPGYPSAPVGYAPFSFPVQAAAPVEVPAYAAVPAPAAVATPAAVPAGWQPDPSGKYQHRWWDGQKWTSSVATNGITGTDA